MDAEKKRGSAGAGDSRKERKSRTKTGRRQNDRASNRDLAKRFNRGDRDVRE